MKPLTRPLTGDELAFIRMFFGGILLRLAEAGAMAYDDEGLTLTNAGGLAACCSTGTEKVDSALDALAKLPMDRQTIEHLTRLGVLAAPGEKIPKVG